MARAKKERAPRRHCVRFRPDKQCAPLPDTNSDEEIEDTGFTLTDIPEEMTHSYRLVKNPFDATGPLPMFEHVFELKPAHENQEDHKLTNDRKRRRRPVETEQNMQREASRSPEHVSPSVEVPLPKITVEPSDYVHRGMENRRPPPGLIAMPEPLFDPAGLAREGLGPRSPHDFFVSAMDPHTPIGAPFSYLSSRRTSLSVQTDVGSSRGPSPSTSSSQDSALSSAEHVGPLRSSGLFDRAVLLDDMHIAYPEENMACHPHSLHPAQHVQFPSFHLHQHHYMPPQYPDFRHPAAFDCPDFQNVQDFFSPPHAALQSGFPTAGRDDMHPERIAHTVFPEATNSHPMHDRFTHNPAHGPLRHARLGQSGSSLIFSVPGSRAAGSLDNSPYPGFLGPHQHFEPVSRSHSPAGRYDQHLSLPTLPPPISRAPTPMRAPETQPLDPRPTVLPPPTTQSVRFIPVIMPAPPPAPRPPPLSVPAPAFDLDLSYPLVDPSKTVSWTTHFDALGRKGKKKTRSKKLKADLPQSGCDPAGNPVFYRCPLCPRSFQRRNGLAIHLKWHYKERDNDGEVLYVEAVASTNGESRVEDDQDQDRTAPPVQGLGIILEPESAPDMEPLQVDLGIGLPSSVMRAPTPQLFDTPSPRRRRHAKPGSTIPLPPSLSDMPGPITPLATPPPTPGGLPSHSFVYKPSTQDDPRARLESAGSMWELFGSED
ncbi:hypothetical protein PHLGIDRAFT_367802 [Phlebiopsis gigantea 11061_1 CR5-6]|uniref:C2H2-type domain-containing protein n=1 Tax=Phlebiopsis gigantea (strain 11061_1 CR5-6) TaxID=745531 RepID=A0A0C3P2F9_PHLG1|nr:hypothetical protein PHLGIDRAFT_367802 [Phlebiopsis gigantea 11061_1 CR5-6]